MRMTTFCGQQQLTPRAQRCEMIDEQAIIFALDYQHVKLGFIQPILNLT